MKPRKSWHPHARYILKAINQIFDFQSRGDIAGDDLVYAGTLRNLHTISESTSYFPDEIKKEYPEIPWREIVGFRNIIVHDYLGNNIDIEVIKNTIDNDLIPLQKAVADILLNYPEET